MSTSNKLLRKSTASTVSSTVSSLVRSAQETLGFDGMFSRQSNVQQHSNNNNNMDKSNQHKLAEINRIIGDDLKLKFEVIKMLLSQIQSDCGVDNTLTNSILNNNQHTIDETINRDLSIDDYSLNSTTSEDREQLEIAMALSLADAEDRKKKEQTEVKAIKKVSWKDRRDEMEQDKLRRRGEVYQFKSYLDYQLERQKSKEAEEEEKRAEEEKQKEMKIQSDIRDFRLRVGIRVRTSLYKELNYHSLKEIETLCDYYENARHNCDLEQLSVNIIQLDETIHYEINQMATIALRMFNILRLECFTSTFQQFFDFFKALVDKIKSVSNRRSVKSIGESKSSLAMINSEEYFPQQFLKYFCPLEVRGDGNCLWHSVSFNLFGDCSMTESLRLLTAATMVQLKVQLEKMLQDQRIKFGYKHELTFSNLVLAALTTGVWGDEFHILALSVALRRPIYCYGSFASIIKQIPDGFRFESLKSYCESNEIHNHFRFVGYEEDDESRDAICIYYDGETHYNPVLAVEVNDGSGEAKKQQAIRPKQLLLDYVFKSAKTPNSEFYLK